MKVLKKIPNFMCLPLPALTLIGCPGPDPGPDTIIPTVTIEVEPASLLFTKDGGNKDVNITSNGDWTVDTPSVDWLTVAPNRGSNNGSITLTADANKSTATLNTSITVRVKDAYGNNVGSKTISVTQSGEDKYLRANPDHPAFAHEGGTMDIAVEANVDWSVNSNTTWCKGEKTSVSALKVTVDPNNSTEERESILTLKDVNGSLSCTVTVKQTGIGTVITVSPTAIEFGPDGGSQDITVTSNGEWEAIANASWCTIDKTGKQKGNATVKVTTGQITSETARSTTISFKCGTETQNVNVTQKGIELTASPASLTSMKADGDRRDITIASNTDWTITSSETWCVPSVSDGKGNGVVSVTVGSNPTTSQRSATLTLAAKNAPSVKRTINVTQEATDIILEVAPTSLNFKADGETKSVTVTCNTDWTATSNQSWCKVTKTSGSATITAEKNTTSSQHSAKVTFKAGNKTAVVDITQDAPGAPVPTPSSLEFEADGGTKNVSLSCSIGWTATSSAAWCTLNKTSGTGDITLAVTAAKNTVTTAREAIITVKAENGLSTTVNVSQKAADVILTVTPATQTVKAAGGNGSLTVESNTSWTASSDQTWCRVATASGTGNGTIALTIDKNEAVTQRTATITVKAGTLTRTATVTQDGADIILTVTGASFKADGGTGSITGTSNTDWTASSNQSWCQLGRTAGTGSGSISLTVTKNTSTSSREATITVKAGSKTAYATVTQSGQGIILTINPTSQSFEADGGSYTVAVTSNTSWNVSSSQPSWCTVSKSSGSNNGSVTVTVAKNPNTTTRTATVTFEANNGGAKVSLNVTQKAQVVVPHTYASPTSLNFGNSVSSQNISVSSNESWTATSSDNSWCVLSSYNGSNDGTITVTVAANTSRSKRTATITVTGSNSGDKTTITVTQTVNAPGEDDNLPPTAPARRKK